MQLARTRYCASKESIAYCFYNKGEGNGRIENETYSQCDLWTVCAEVGSE